MTRKKRSTTTTITAAIDVTVSITVNTVATTAKFITERHATKTSNLRGLASNTECY